MSEPTDLQWAQEFCKKVGYLAPKIIRPNEYAAVCKMVATTAIITAEVGDEYQITGRYCFHTHHQAMMALAKWDAEKDPDPEGWHRHLPSNRRLAETPFEFDENGKSVPLGAIYVYP